MSDGTSVAIDSVVVVVEEQVSTEMDGEAVILSLNSGTYFSLNSVGARIWELVQSARPVSEIRDAIIDEYEVDPETAERDILALLGALAEHKLINIQSEKN